MVESGQVRGAPVRRLRCSAHIRAAADIALTQDAAGARSACRRHNRAFAAAKAATAWESADSHAVQRAAHDSADPGVPFGDELHRRQGRVDPSGAAGGPCPIDRLRGLPDRRPVPGGRGHRGGGGGPVPPAAARLGRGARDMPVARGGMLNPRGGSEQSGTPLHVAGAAAPGPMALGVVTVGAHQRARAVDHRPRRGGRTPPAVGGRAGEGGTTGAGRGGGAETAPGGRPCKRTPCRGRPEETATMKGGDRTAGRDERAAARPSPARALHRGA